MWRLVEVWTVSWLCIAKPGAETGLRAGWADRYSDETNRHTGRLSRSDGQRRWPPFTPGALPLRMIRRSGSGELFGP
jgi:hypothetical protein